MPSLVSFYKIIFIFCLVLIVLNDSQESVLRYISALKLPLIANKFFVIVIINNHVDIKLNIGLC